MKLGNKTNKYIKQSHSCFQKDHIRSTDNVGNFAFVSKYYSFSKTKSFTYFYITAFLVPILHTLMSCIALFNHDFVCNIIIAELIHREVMSTPSVHGVREREGKREGERGMAR